MQGFCKKNQPILEELIIPGWWVRLFAMCSWCPAFLEPRPAPEPYPGKRWAISTEGGVRPSL